MQDSCSNATYIAACQADGVLLPPPVGQWPQRVDLTRADLFLHIDKRTTVYKYAEPGRGRCTAFARYQGGIAQETAFGVICENASASRACFFDNQVCGEGGASTTRLGFEAMLATPLSGLAAPARYSQVCTDCHRGNNALLVHAGRKLGHFLCDDWDCSTGRSGRFEAVPPPMPSNAADWRFSMLDDPALRACTGCHGIAAPRAKRDGYCALLQYSANTTMPADGGPPAGWEHPQPQYREAVNSLRAACGFGKEQEEGAQAPHILALLLAGLFVLAWAASERRENASPSSRARTRCEHLPTRSARAPWRGP